MSTDIRPLPSKRGATQEVLRTFACERQGQNLTLTFLHVPYSLDSGMQDTCVYQRPIINVPPKRLRMAVLLSNMRVLPRKHAKGLQVVTSLPRISGKGA